MSAWLLVILGIGGSAATIAVNVVVIAWIYGKKEARWDAFCEESKKQEADLNWLMMAFCAHTGIARNGVKYIRVKEDH